MDQSADLLARFARAQERAKGYKPPVEPRSINDAGVPGQVLHVEVVRIEPFLDQTILYLRQERSVPTRHVTSRVEVAATILPGARGTVTFRPRSGSAGGTWDFEPSRPAAEGFPTPGDDRFVLGS